MATTERVTVTLPVDLIAYPNPVTDKVNISMKGIETYERIQVYDRSGRTNSVTCTIRSQDMLEIDMSELSPGAYFIRVEMKNTSRIFPVIKQ